MPMPMHQPIIILSTTKLHTYLSADSTITLISVSSPLIAMVQIHELYKMKTRNTTTCNNTPIGHTCTIISDEQNEVVAMDIDEDSSDDDDDEEEDTGLCAQLEDEDILERLKNNDPTITKLQIIFAHFDSDKEGIDASTIDWAGEES